MDLRQAQVSPINWLIALSENVTYLEVGDRTLGDEVEYPNDDLKPTQLPNGEWALTHKDGRAY
jgi:uncharacterized cupin superfamily protein